MLFEAFKSLETVSKRLDNSGVVISVTTYRVGEFFLSELALGD